MNPVAAFSLPFCAAAILLTGCAMQGPFVRASTLAGYVEYAGEVRGLDGVALEREYAAASQAHSLAPSADSAVRLALLLSDPRASFFDPDRAMALLEPDTSGAAAEVGASTEFAAFLHAMIAPLADARTSLAETSEALAEERRLRESLQQQLDALKALEERLNASDLGR